MAKRPYWLNEWFEKTIADSRFSVQITPWKNSKSWNFIDGSLSHTSGRFFKVVGVRHKQSNGTVTLRPLMEQREIGTLGFVVHGPMGERQILVQAKIEPGNIGTCQLAPTFQATASNASQVHGGIAPAYKDLFYGTEEGTLQSEQGTRFLGKLNRNVMLAIDRMLEPTPLHKWVSIPELLSLLDTDHAINTDARSVLVCAEWEQLAAKPFTSRQDAFTKLLQKSYATKKPRVLKSIASELKRLRAQESPFEIVPLEYLAGWRITDTTIESETPGAFSVVHINVVSHDREVQAWDQPIINSPGKGYADVHCTVIEGVLHFYLPPQTEAGLLHKVELGPSYLSEPGEENVPPEVPNARIHAQVVQSDEGGRFYQDATLYRLMEVDNTILQTTDIRYWLTLRDIKELLAKGGYLTNEARSALSLVLRWL